MLTHSFSNQTQAIQFCSCTKDSTNFGIFCWLYLYLLVNELGEWLLEKQHLQELFFWWIRKSAAGLVVVVSGSLMGCSGGVDILAYERVLLTGSWRSASTALWVRIWKLLGSNRPTLLLCRQWTWNTAPNVYSSSKQKVILCSFGFSASQIFSPDELWRKEIIEKERIWFCQKTWLSIAISVSLLFTPVVYYQA